MGAEAILGWARRAAGLSHAVLAVVAQTSRPKLSASEQRRKSPTLQTAARIMAAAGFELTVTPRVEFRVVSADRERPILVPTALPRLPVERALEVVELPLHLNWSDRGRRFDLRDRRQRVRVYEIVLREGGPDDIASYIDGVLLVDLWDELVLPRAIRSAWRDVLAGVAESRVA